jgi:hypothetical protein
MTFECYTASKQTYASQHEYYITFQQVTKVVEVIA